MKCENVTLAYQDHTIIEQLDMEISSGEFNCPPWLSLGAMKLITRILDPNPMTHKRAGEKKLRNLCYA